MYYPVGNTSQGGENKTTLGKSGFRNNYAFYKGKLNQKALFNRAIIQVCKMDLLCQIPGRKPNSLRVHAISTATTMMFKIIFTARGNGK